MKTLCHIIALALLIVGIADAQQLLSGRRQIAAVTAAINNPTNLATRMFWYEGNAAYTALGEGVNVGTNLAPVIDGPVLYPHTSRFFGVSNNWVNGHAALLFLSSSDHVTNQTTTGVTWPQPFYHFIVQRTTAGGATQRVLTGTNAVGYIITSGNLNRIAAGTNLEGGNATNAWVIVTSYFNGANSWIRTNGVAAVAGNAGPTDWVGITLGRGYDGGAGWSGFLAETFATADTLSTNDIIGLEQFLGAKYGITVP